MHSDTMNANLTRGLVCATAALGVACLGYAAYALAPSASMTLPQAQAKTKTFKPGKNAHANWKKLNGLLTGNKKKTVKIKKGSNFKVDAPLRPGNNTKIIATGSTITITKRGSKTKQDLIFPTPKATNYNSFKNLTIQGGKWRSYQKDGYTGGLIALAHGQNIVLDGIDVNANWEGHAIEIMACKNVTIKNCKIWSIGKLSSTSKEEALQIDLATKKSTPQVATFGSKYVQGQTCENVTVENCYIDGARGLCASYNNSEDGKWLGQYHKNITVKDNVIQGRTAEAVALFNTVGATVTGNTLVSHSTNAKYAAGFQAALFGTAPTEAGMDASTLDIENNMVYGDEEGIEVRGYFTKEKPRKVLQQFGTVIVRNNESYVKTDGGRPIFVVHEGHVHGDRTTGEASAKTEIIENNTPAVRNWEQISPANWDGSAVAATWNGAALSL